MSRCSNSAKSLSRYQLLINKNLWQNIKVLLRLRMYTKMNTKICVFFHGVTSPAATSERNILHLFIWKYRLFKNRNNLSEVLSFIGWCCYNLYSLFHLLYDQDSLLDPYLICCCFLPQTLDWLNWCMYLTRLTIFRV